MDVSKLYKHTGDQISSDVFSDLFDVAVAGRRGGRRRPLPLPLPPRRLDALPDAQQALPLLLLPPLLLLTPLQGRRGAASLVGKDGS